MAGIYDFTVKDIHGKDVKLDTYKGKALLIVNTASECGFTPQYKGLEEVYRKLGGKGLVILGFPCNQFGKQEPGGEAEIESFCEVNYGVTFPLFAKIDVNGDEAAPLYKYLKHAKPGLLGSEAIKWNFTKFLVDREGNVIERYAPNAEPASIAPDIEKVTGVTARPVAFFVVAFVIASALAPARVLAQPDPSKVIHASFPTPETGFDPQAAGDEYSNSVNRVIFDPLYRYDYLARPYKLVPNTAVGMPEISADGKTWTIKIRPGIYFADDPVFKGQRRELTAADYVYGWKRVLDPAMRSNFLAIFDGHFAGADAIAAKAKETGKFDYDTPMEGLQAVDRYTIRMQLNYADYELLANLTTVPTAGIAREIVEAYRDGAGWVMANPVGTGPYRLKEWRRGQRIVLEANPTFRDELYPESSSPDDKAFAKYKGKKLPLAGRIEISIIEESNPRLLAFEQGDLDYVTVPPDLVPNVLDAANKLKPGFTEKGIALARGIQPAITYSYFNMEDAVVGGYTPDKIALRRAIGMAYNVGEEIRVLRAGQAVPATQPVPPNVSGYNPKFDGHAKFDPAAAKALLDKFGYVDRDNDGWRDMPDGKPLLLKIGSGTSALDRQYNELWKRSLDGVNIKVEFINQKFADLLKMARLGQLQMWFLGNINATPEGFGFLSLLYGPHAGFSNLARFKLPEYDRLYEQARAMPDGPARTKILQRMSELVTIYAPWNLHAYRYENVLTQPWLAGYKYNAFDRHPWRYYDVDLKRRKTDGK